MPFPRVSTAVPRTNPEMIRPPEKQSSMAISSAIRMGSLTAMTFPRMAILAFLVTLAMTVMSRFTAGFMHQVGRVVLVAHDAIKAHLIGPGVLLMILIVENVGFFRSKWVLWGSRRPDLYFSSRRR